jgi:hypothetical protein
MLINYKPKHSGRTLNIVHIIIITTQSNISVRGIINTHTTSEVKMTTFQAIVSNVTHICIYTSNTS